MPVDNKGIADGPRRGERKCIDPKAGDADLWIKIWEELHLLMSKENLVDVEHVKAHRTRKEKKDTSQFEKFVTWGNEKADELAKAGAMLDEELTAEAKAETVQHEKRCMRPCSTQRAFTVWLKRRKVVKSSSRRQKEKWIFVDEKRDIKRSGVLRPTSIDA